MAQSVDQLFSAHARTWPDRIAMERGPGRITYGTLEHRSNQIAGLLLESELEPGTLVGIMSDDPFEIVAAMLGILKAGCAFVPLDPNVPNRRLAEMMNVVGLSWIVADHDHLSTINDLQAERDGDLTVIVRDPVPHAAVRTPGSAALLPYGERDGSVCPEVPRDPERICYVYFTSGSTGTPKAIMGRSKSVTHFILWEIKTFGVGESDRVSQLASPSFDAYLRDVFTPLCAGGTVCAPPDRDMLLDPEALMTWLDAERITLLHTVPSVFRSLLNQRLDAGRFAGLRHILLAGEPLLPADVRRWFDTFGERVGLTNLYGPSETTMTKLFHRVQPSDGNRQSIPIGKPMEGARAMVFDAKGQPCSVGVIGEIYIRTPYRSLGYFRQPELTLASFIPNPLGSDPNDIVYKTGDMGRFLPDGNLEFLGRRDRQVKIRGVRVELVEIESELRRHDSVRDVAVIDRDDDEGGKYLAAYVVLMPRVPADELRQFLAERLPSAIIPTMYVEMDILPRLLNGKIDRAALPLPAELDARRQIQYVPPRTPTEHALAAIWEELLQLAAPGIHNNFFTVGGHSLLAMQVITRVEAAFSINVPLRDFLEEPTIQALAEKIDATILAQSASADSLFDFIEGLDESEARSMLIGNDEDMNAEKDQ
ncbi:MAG TPA: non-ribosomal peptide synthetase [Candidatus Kapabacteria bacterium]|nr:non-ribosomal peptide synthetase [Candidatus Kapabacteria bacterium]